MGWMGVTEFALAVLAVVILVPLVWLFLRRRWLSRQGNMFDCSLRLRQPAGHSRWMLGVARYQGDELEWFKVFTWRLGPRFVVRQGEWLAGQQREPDSSEALLLFEHQVIVTLASRTGAELELAIEPGSLTGFLSWLESAAPGRARYGNTAD